MAENKGVLDDMNAAQSRLARTYLVATELYYKDYILPFFQMHTPAAEAVDIIPGQ